MSGDKPKNQAQPDDLAQVRESFSTRKWKSAIDDRIRRHPALFDFFWKYRLWWLIAGAATFVLPVLRDANIYALSYSGSSNLYGFDLLVPMLSASHDNGVTSYTSFSINPEALVIYGLVAVHLYLFFVRTPVSPRLTFWHGCIQGVATLLFPFLDIPTMNLLLHGFNSYWHIQPPLVGFWILLIAGGFLKGGAYAQLLKSDHHTPPPLS
jgi:hypothetical protein